MSFKTTFGFGKKTDIELPGETNGILPSRKKDIQMAGSNGAANSLFSGYGI